MKRVLNNKFSFLLVAALAFSAADSFGKTYRDLAPGDVVATDADLLTKLAGETKTYSVTNDYLYLVFAGQSNMAGTSGKYPPQWMLTGIDGAVMFNQGSVTDPMRLANPYAWGPWMQAARRLVEEYPEKTIYVCVYAVGATSVVEWQKGTAIYTNLMEKISAFSATEGIGKPTAFLWGQGESDAEQPAHSNYLATFVTDLRADLSDDLIFIQSGIHNDDTLYPVNKDKELFAAADVKNYYFPTSDYEVRPDEPIHFNDASLMRIGDAFADQIIRAQSTAHIKEALSVDRLSTQRVISHSGNFDTLDFKALSVGGTAAGYQNWSNEGRAKSRWKARNLADEAYGYVTFNSITNEVGGAVVKNPQYATDTWPRNGYLNDAGYYGSSSISSSTSSYFNTSLDISSNNFTWCAWARPGASASGRFSIGITGAQSAGTWQNNNYVEVSTNGVIQFRTLPAPYGTTSGGYYVRSYTIDSVYVNDWVHYAGVREDDLFTWYVNGIAACSTTNFSIQNGATKIPNTYGDVGGRADVDDCFFWERALSADEINFMMYLDTGEVE